MAGRTTRRGYGTAHQRMREYWRPIVAGGRVACARCGRIIGPGDPWDLGHDDHDRSKYSGPECQRCNRGTKGRHRDPKPRPLTRW